MIFLRLFSLSLLTTFSLLIQAAPATGDWAIHGALASSFYEYEEDEVRSEFPVSITSLLDDNDIVGDDSDIANYSVGVVYYFTPRLNVSGTYTDGIEIGWLDDIFESPKFDADLQMFELDLTYRVAELNSSLGLFVKAGAVFNRINIEVYEYQEASAIALASSSENKFGAKFGLGLQWDFAESWSAKLGYSHFTFMSIDKTYLQFEYRF